MVMIFWTVQELRMGAYRLLQNLSAALEPPEIAVDKLKFEPARSVAAKLAIDAGWLEGLRDGHVHTSSELMRPGQSEELLSKYSYVR